MFKTILVIVGAVCVARCLVSKDTLDTVKDEVKKTWEGGLENARQNWNSNTNWEFLKVKPAKKTADAAC